MLLVFKEFRVSTLYIISRAHRSETIAKQALRTWRPRSDVAIVHLCDSGRTFTLSRLIGDERHSFNQDCFAIDSNDECAVSDFNAFLSALRLHESTQGVMPSVVRDLYCRI